MGEVYARRYELLDPIAEGGMGSVWVVLDHVDGQEKVAKLLRQRDAGDLLRFMREQATRIHHQHVVTPISWVGEDDSILFTMPLIRGGSVSGLIKRYGPLPPAWVAVIVDQTLDALAAVHHAGVVHRDVKPANLLLDPTGAARPHLRLTDFGIAGVHGEPRLTGPAHAIGTPGYMAPEQKYGANPHPTQDLHGIAATGLEMLTGKRPPFADADLPDTPLAQVLRRGMNNDPRQRPATAEAMRAELAPFVPREWSPGPVRVDDQFTAPGAPRPPARGRGTGSGPFTGPQTGGSPHSGPATPGSGSGPRPWATASTAQLTGGVPYGPAPTGWSGLQWTLLVLGVLLLGLSAWLLLG